MRYDPDAPRFTFDYANNAWLDDYEPTVPWRPRCREDEIYTREDFNVK